MNAELRQMEMEQGTYHIGSDSYAFTVVSTLSPCRKLVEVDGLGLKAISKRHNGKWYEMGQKQLGWGFYTFGIAQTDLDPSF